MSITLNTTPTTIQSAYSAIVFEVTTDASNIQTKILAEVYYKRKPGDFWTKCGKKIQDKYINKYYYKFNISNVLQKVLSYDYKDSAATGLYSKAENSCIEYYVKFTEYWPNSTTGVYEAHDTASSSSYYCSNATMLKTEDQALTDYLLATGSTRKFLTNSPSNVPIRVGEKAELHFLTSETVIHGKIKETKIGGSTSTTNYDIAAQSLFQYFWPFEIDASDAVTVPNQASYIEAISSTGGSGLFVMPDDTNTIWGGARLVGTTHQVDILLPSGTLSIEILAKAVGGAVNVDVSYYHSGAWQASSTTFAVTTGAFVTYSHTLPTGAFTITKVRLTKTSASPNALYMAYGKANWTSTLPINKRCILNIASNLIQSDTAKIECWIEDATTRISEIKTFTADHTVYSETTRISWMNHRNGIDHYTFTAAHSENWSVEKVNFIRELQTTFNKYDRGKGVAFVDSDIVFSCFSEFENTDKLRWIAEINESIEAFLILSDVRYAIEIVTNEVTPKKQTELLQVEAKWRFANKRNIQNG